MTETTSWGVLYYAFPVLASRIGEDTGWSLTRLSAAFSLALLISAVVGIAVGRWLDRHEPRWLMSAGSALAAAALAGVALAPSFGWFVGSWVVAGVAMSAVLYPPAFAALTRWYGERRVHALTVLTLAAGLASTIFAPLTTGLAAQLGWRTTYLVLAGLLAVVTVPAHVLGLRRPWPEPAPAPRVGVAHAPRTVVRSRAFVCLVAAFALTSLTAYVVVVNLVPLLAERGFSAGTAALMVRGISTLLQATSVTDRWGSRDYGVLSSVAAAPSTVTLAVAPVVGAGLAALLGGYASMLVCMAVIGVAAAALSLGSLPSPTRPAAVEP